jgi:hypothetical protein
LAHYAWAADQQQPNSQSALNSKAGEEFVLQHILDQIEPLHQQLQAIKEKIDASADPPLWKNPTLLAGLIAAASGFGVALLTIKWNRDSLKEGRLETHVFEALKWFESGTQSRSIGLSVIEANWQHTPKLQATWVSILINLAVFLIAEKNKADIGAHELNNRRRILMLLKNTTLSEAQGQVLKNALKEDWSKVEQKRNITGDEVIEWLDIVKRSGLDASCLETIISDKSAESSKACGGFRC